MTIDLDDLERQARAATPGPWKAGDPAWFRGRQNPEDGKRPLTAELGGVIANIYGAENAAHIAANSPDVTLALIVELRAARAELDRWQHCANCHERMDAPGHCGNAESEAERGWRETAEGYLDQIRALRASLTAWERAVDDCLVTNWIGVYESSEPPHEAIKRVIQDALDQDRDRLDVILAALGKEQP